MYHAPGGRQYTQRAPGPPCPSIVGQRPALGGAQALAATRSQQRTPPQPPPKPWLAPRELNCGQQGSPHPLQQQPVAVRPLPQPQPAGAKHMLQRFQRVLKPHQQGQKVAAQFAYGPELDQLAYEQLAEEAGAYGHEEEASRGARYDNLSMKELINLCESMGLDTSAAEGKQDLLCLLDNVAIQYSGSLNSTSEILRTAVDSYGKNKETLRRCLDQLDSVIRSSTDVLGKQAPTDVLKQIPEWRKALELSECELLVLGDACAGKSSFLNLLLGQDILPNSALLCTPAICEIRYDKEPRLVARYQRSSQTIELKKRSEQEQRDVFTKFLNKANADQAQDGLEKVEVYLNSDILKSGAVLVDSPGLNDNDVLSDMVLDYAKRGVSMMVLLDMTRGFTKSTRDCLLAIKEARAFDASSTVFVLSKADLVDPSEREAKIEEILASLQSFHHDIERSSLFPLNVKAAAGALKVDLVVPDLSHFNAGFLALLVQAFKRKLLKYHIKASDVAKKMEILIQAGIKSAKLDRKAKLAMCILALRFLANAEEQAKQGLDRCLKIYEREIAKLCETLTKLLTRLEVREEIIRHASEMNLGITNSDDWNNAMQKAFLRALLLVAEKHMGKELSETRKNLKQEAFRFSDEVALIIKQAEAVLFDSAPVSHQGTQPAEDTSLGWGAYAAIVIMAPLWIPAGIIAAVVVVGINWLRKNRYAKWEKDPVQIQRKFAAKAMAEFTRKPVDESVVSFLLMQGGTFEDFVQNLTTYYRKTIEDLVAFLEKVKADDSPALGEKYAQLAGPVARIRWKLDHLYIHALRSSTIQHTDVKFKEQIGEGAFGNVFKAVLYPGSPEEQVVAVKRLKAAASTEAQNVLLLQLFAGEEATISSLKHPNIVHFIGSYIDEDHYYIVTEFVEAGTLGTCVPRQKKKEMLVGIISGLAYLHSLNIAHRDLKPQNILVTGSGVPKLTDFGLAKEERYVSGTLCGTPLYMAPEVLLGDYEAKSADVFSAAIIMWEVMFSRSYLDSLAGKPVNFKTLAEQRPQIPDGVDSRISDLLTQSWNANAHKRPNFATILQVLQAIPASVFAEL